MTSSKLGRNELALLWLAFAAALAVRILPFTDEVFQPDGVVMPWGCPDVYYHLHRIIVAAKNWPQFPEFDLWRNYPDGAYSLWSPLFEVIPAGFAVLTGMAPLHVGVVWPALLGALALFPLFDVLRRLHGRIAWLGVALFLVLPGSLSFATLGRADHHVGEVLMQLWIYALTLRQLLVLTESRRLPRRSALALGVVMGLSLWMWRGSVVILLPVAGTALLLAATSQQPELRLATVRHFALAFFAAALVTAPYGVLNAVRGRDAFAAYFLSLLQPAILTCWALLMPVAGQLGQTRRQLGPLLRGRNALALGAVAMILAVAVDGVRAGTAFLTGVGDPWAATIEESRPVWSGGLALDFMLEELGFMPYVLAVSLVVLLARLIRRWPPSPVSAFVLLWASSALLLACMQVRFVYYAAPVVVAVPGALWHALRGRRALQLGATLLALASLWPVTRYFTPVLDGDPRTQLSPMPVPPRIALLMAELHFSTPPAGDAERPDVRPAYCVLAPWDLGNYIQTMAKRPVLASSGGPHETAAFRDTVLFAERLTLESEAAALMTRRGCRYAITELGSGNDPGFMRVFARRLHAGSGSDLGVHDGSGRFRFRFESRLPERDVVAKYKVFELVPGAVLRFPKGATALQTQVSSSQRAFRYRRELHAADADLVQARVSQPGVYQVFDAAGRVIGEAEVTEQAVMGGKTLVFAQRGS